MGSSKKVTVGYWHKLLYHAGLSKGPIDAFLEFRGGDKTAWQGELTASGTINIDQPKLWGGEKDQGGIVSDVDVMFGESTQAANAYLLANLGPQVPAWRGLSTLVFKGGKYGAMNPYPQKASYKIRQILQGWDGGTAWYAAKAPIGTIMTRAPVASPNGWPSYSTGWLNIGCSQEIGGSLTSYQNWFKGFIDSVRVTKGVARYTTTNYAVPTAEFDTTGADPYWSSVLFCVLFNGSDGSTTITDAKGHSCAAYNGAALSTAQSKFGGSSCYFDGVNDRVQINFTGGEENLGQTFTLEAWVNIDELRSGNFGNPILSAGPLSTGHKDTNWSVYGDKEWFGIDDTGSTGGVTIVATAEPIGTGQWYFLSLSRDGATGMYYLHVNGVLATGSPDMPASMNPAHVLYFARTNSDLGREPTANINDASLRAAADTLYAEGFGICTTRDPAQESVEEFEGRIAKLIDGSFSRDPITGLWHLDLSRGNYVLGDLPILTDDDVLEFREIPTTLDNAINSVSITYFDPQLKESITTPPVQARALIQDFGTIHQAIEYPEIPTASLAARVALRELRATATPTRAFDLVCTRKPYAWRPNTYFRLKLPKRGIADMVCIVGEKESGGLKSGAIRLKAAQDIYSMPAFSFVENEPGVDTGPSQVPLPITLQAAFEAPYIEVVGTLSRADLAVLPADAGYLLAMAADPATSINYKMMVDSGGGYVETASGDWCPTATVVAASSWLDTAFTLAGGTRLDEVVVGSAALWDNEIVRVDAINPTTGAITLGRACADTLPAQHGAGSRIWFYQDSEAVDPTEYSAGEALDIKLLTNTGSQQIDIAVATAMSVGMGGRQVLPYPPANIKINGAYYPASIGTTAPITITWAHRDRVLQADQLIDFLEGDIGPEPGVTYTIWLYGETDTLLRTETGLTGTSYTWTAEEADSGLTSPTTADYDTEVAADSPAARWKLDETSGIIAIDSVGGNNGTYAGATLAQPGLLVSGTAVLLSGSGSRITVPDAAALDLGANFTLRAWVKTSSAAVQRLYDKCEAGSTWPAYALKILANGMVSCEVRSGNADNPKAVATTTITVKDGLAHMIDAVFVASGTLKIYIDGVERASVNHSIASAWNNANSLYIGNRGAAYPEPFAGILDELALFGTALSQGRITAHYNAGAFGAGPGAPRLNDRVTVEIAAVRGALGSLHYSHTVERLPPPSGA